MSRAFDNSMDVLRDLLRQKMNEMSDHVATGSCKDYSEYTHSCGVIQGLALAERELLDLKERIEGA